MYVRSTLLAGAGLTPKAAGSATVSKSQDFEPGAGRCLSLCEKLQTRALLPFSWWSKRIFISTQHRLHPCWILVVRLALSRHATDSYRYTAYV